MYLFILYRYFQVYIYIHIFHSHILMMLVQKQESFLKWQVYECLRMIITWLEWLAAPEKNQPPCREGLCLGI